MDYSNAKSERMKSVQKSVFVEVLFTILLFYTISVLLVFSSVLLGLSEGFGVNVFLLPIGMIFTFPFFSLVLLTSASGYMLIPLLTLLIIYFMVLNSKKNKHKLLRVLVNTFGLLIIFSLPSIVISYVSAFWV